ncbi:MAG: hypothetical protein AB7I18_04015 [Candidatus Berkiella sp.]
MSLQAFDNLKIRMTEPDISQYLQHAKQMPDVMQKLATMLSVTPHNQANQNYNAKDMQGQELVDYNYCGSNFKFAKIGRSVLFLVDMHSTRADSLKAQDTTIEYVDCTRAQLKNGSFNNSKMSFISFVGANLENCSFFNVQCGKGVLMIGSNIHPKMAPKGAILTPDDLQRAIETEHYSQDELKFILHVLKQGKLDIASSRQSAVAGSDYLTASHEDQVTQGIEVVQAMLKDLERKNRPS